MEGDPSLELAANPVPNAASAIALAVQHRPDVVLMDINLPGPQNGIDATRRIKELCPETAVLVMSGSHDESEVLVEAAEAGAAGFLDKARAVDDLVASLKAAAIGEMLIDPRTLAGLLRTAAEDRRARQEAGARLQHLTGRENEMLQLLAQGLLNEEIAAQLHISVRTVQTHVQNVLKKLGVHSKLQAVAFAAKHGALSE
jgi:DNA-binding NarL/FixJ family response regulator